MCIAIAASGCCTWCCVQPTWESFSPKTMSGAPFLPLGSSGTYSALTCSQQQLTSNCSELCLEFTQRFLSYFADMTAHSRCQMDLLAVCECVCAVLEPTLGPQAAPGQQSPFCRSSGSWCVWRRSLSASLCARHICAGMITLLRAGLTYHVGDARSSTVAAALPQTMQILDVMA